jgi:hypothetical protein
MLIGNRIGTRGKPPVHGAIGSRPEDRPGPSPSTSIDPQILGTILAALVTRLSQIASRFLLLYRQRYLVPVLLGFIFGALTLRIRPSDSPHSNRGLRRLASSSGLLAYWMAARNPDAAMIVAGFGPSQRSSARARFLGRIFSNASPGPPHRDHLIALAVLGIGIMPERGHAAHESQPFLKEDGRRLAALRCFEAIREARLHIRHPWIRRTIRARVA